MPAGRTVPGMKTTLYASLSVNGHVTRAEADGPVRPEVLADFRAHVARAGNLVLGRRTFELATAAPGGETLFAGVDVVVLSRLAAALPGGPGVQVAGSAADALNHLRHRGHASALLGGGPATYAAFLEQGLVDEWCLNVAPLLSATGPLLPPPADPTRPGAPAGSTRLRLLGLRHLADDIVQLRYTVADHGA